MSAGLKIGLVYDDTIDRDGGIPLYVTTLGGALRKRGHEVEYLVGCSRAQQIGGVRVRSLARNVSVRFNGNALSMPVWSRARDLDRALERGGYDVLHVQVPYSPLMAGRLVARADPRCAVIGTYHVASDRALPCLGAWLLRALKLPSASRFDEIVSVSVAAASFAARWSRMDAHRIVPNMLDLAAIPACQPGNEGNNAIDVAFVGRLVPRKGARELIDAIALLDERRSRPTRVVIVGEGPHRERLQRRVRDLGLGDTVVFLGRVDDRTKFAVLSAARIACFPSRFGESFGIVILEALAAGAGVVLAGRNPGYGELLAPEGLVDAEDSAAFAARLGELLDDAAARRALGARQRALLPRFDSEIVVEEILRVYRAALARRSRDAAADFRKMALGVAA